MTQKQKTPKTSKSKGKTATKPKGTHRRLTHASVLKAIEGCYGNTTRVAAKLGVQRTTLYRYFARYPEIEELHLAQREVMIDHSEGYLHDVIRGEEATDDHNVRLKATIYYLSTQGKGRGYTTRTETEVSGRDGGPVELRTLPAPDGGVPLEAYAAEVRDAIAKEEGRE